MSAPKTEAAERPVRVLHVAEAFGGGLLEMIRLIAEHAAAEGSPQAIAYGRRPETPADVRSVVGAGVELYELPWGRRTVAGELRAIRALRALARDWRADVVHLHSSFASVTGRMAFGRGDNIVFTPNAFASALSNSGRAKRLAMAAVENLAVRSVAVVGAVSQSEAELARARGARDVVVIHNGIVELDDPPPARSPERPSGRRPRIIGSGRVTEQRRPEACARILSRVADAADVEWVGGGGKADREGDAGIAALRSAGIPVSGWLPRERVLEEVRSADAYLHWTSWDGLPFSVMEAMAVDTVVVASDIAPNRELLDPRQLCRTEDEAVALLRRLVGDPALAADLRAEQARRRAPFSARVMSERWLELYRGIAAGRRQRLPAP